VSEEKQSLEEWLADERRRLDEGFSYEPAAVSKSESSPANDILTELGFGAGVLGSLVSGHPNPVTFEGCSASTIVNALASEFEGSDTKVEISGSPEEATTVSILQRQEMHHQFFPALTVTLVESEETLVIAVSDLSQDAKREAASSLGKAALRSSRGLLLRERGLGGVLHTADNLLEGIEDVVEDVQDLSLPRRVWAVIDRVGRAAEDAYLEEQSKKQAAEQRREAAERAWTRCEWCGRAYGRDQEDVVQCPSCGAPRGVKPAWLP